MGKRNKSFFLFFVGLFFLQGIFAQEENSQTLELTLLSTTDLHCAILSYDYYKDCEELSFGLERTATLIAQARKEFPHTLLFDIGDAIQGNPLADYKARVKPVRPEETHPIYKVMNYLAYDAAVIGNHEFNYGLDFLSQVTQKAQFPLLLANVSKTSASQPLFPPYLLLEKTFNQIPLKIGIIGFTPPQILQWDRDHLWGKVEVEDIVKCAKRYIPEMRAKGADLVIALAHSGLVVDPYTEKMEQACYHLAQVEGVDALFFGHSHSKFPGDERFNGLQEKGVDNQKGRIKGCPSVMAGFWGNTLGLIHLSLEKTRTGWKVIQSHGELRSIQSNGIPVEPDPEVRKLIQQEHEETIQYINTPVCTSTIPISTYFSHLFDTAAIQIINNAQIAYIRKQLQETPYANFPLLASVAPFKTDFRGTGYTDIPVGGVSIKHIADLYLYPNTLHAVKIKGDIVKAWIEHSTQIFKQIDPNQEGEQELLNPQIPSYNHDILDGVTYQIDISKPVGNRVQNLQYQGQAVTPEMEFIVATNNYRAGGGGRFPGLDGNQTIFRSPDTVQEILIDYFKTQQVITEKEAADYNWSLCPLPLKGKVLFKSRIDLEAVIQKLPKPSIQLLRKEGSQFIYQFQW